MENEIYKSEWNSELKDAVSSFEDVEITNQETNKYENTELTVSVDVREYNDKELTLRELQIEEDISVGSEYAEVRQFLVDEFEKRFGYSIDLSGKIKQVAT